MGRGVFATKPINQGQLLVVEEAIAEGFCQKEVPFDGFHQFIKRFWDIAQLKGIHALRMSYILGGPNEEKVPLSSLFYNNNYKQNYKNVPDIQFETLKEIVMKNNFGRKAGKKLSAVLFGFCSFFNHNENPNVKMKFLETNLVTIHATRHIEEGE